MGVDERMGDLPREVLVGLECSVDGLGEAPVDVVLEQRFSVAISARRHGDAFFALDFPYAVIAKSPERVFGVGFRPVRTEVAEQRSERSVRDLVGRESWFAGETATDGPQGKERLVGGALFAGTPDSECLEFREERLGAPDFHDWMRCWKSAVS